MLSLSTDITDLKDLGSLSPVLLIDFIDVGVAVGSQAITLASGSGSDGDGTGGTYDFVAASAKFVTWNIMPNDIIIISSVARPVSEVISETQLIVASISTPSSSGLTWSITHEYDDLLLKGDGVGISSSIPELINSVSSISGVTINLTDYRSSLRTPMIGSSPNLVDSQVKIHVKFDSSVTTIDDIIQVYYGKITDYRIHRDIITLTIKNYDVLEGVYPDNLLLDESASSAAADNTVKPLQYGDFMWDYDFRFYADAEGQGGLAICPVYLASQNLANDTVKWTLMVAGHEMNTLAGIADQTWLLSATTDLPTMFVMRGRELAFLSVNAWDATGIFNTSTDCYFLFYSSSPTYPIKALIMRAFTAAGTGNVLTGWANTVDGKAATYTTITTTFDVLSVKSPDFSNISGSSLNGTGANCYAFVDFGLVTGTDFHVIDYSLDGSTWYSGNNAINSVDSSTIVMFNLASATIAELEDLNTLQVRIIHSAESGASIVVQNIVIFATVDDLSTSDSHVLLRCKGREYSGTWGSRKTAGNLITNPIDMIESVFRDVLGNTNLDTASFDAMNSYFSAKSIVVNTSIYQQKSGRELLKDLCQSLHVSLIPTFTNNWRIVSFDTTVAMFSSSGTDSPAAQDIYTDTDTITNGAYTNHPIVKGSFGLRRSSLKNVYPQVDLNYDYTGSVYRKSISSGTDALIKVSNTKTVANTVSATALVNVEQEWYGNQKFIASFRTFYNAIGVELGDVINIRHNDLNDSMLYATVNTQKWMVIDLDLSWHPGQIAITAIELRSS